MTLETGTKQCLHIRITGCVQGVCFRHYANMEAHRIGVTGHVRNLQDGSVEALICGNAKQLDAMQQWLSHGPKMACVDGLRIHDANQEKPSGDFRIIY
ncbi:MAG: acylphosphatase [Mariprofundaceae bacterium]|nr:acylphosphatase [Mariprofundaceae bacterium]